MSNSLQPHGLQLASLLCPALFPWIFSNSCALSQWCHPTISSSASHYSSCPHSFPASGPFQWAGSLNQVAKVFGISASVLPMNIQGWFPLGLTVLMSLQTKELSKVFSSSTIQKHNSSQFNPLYGLILTCVHDYWKYQALTIQSFVNKVMSLLFSILSCFVKAFLSRSKHLLLSWVHS